MHARKTSIYIQTIKQTYKNNKVLLNHEVKNSRALKEGEICGKMQTQQYPWVALEIALKLEWPLSVPSWVKISNPCVQLVTGGGSLSKRYGIGSA